MIQRKVNAALLLRDGFTGRTFPDGAGTQCLLDGVRLRKPVWKQEGYLVLTDLAPGEHTLTLRRPGYREETVTFRAEPDRVLEDAIEFKPGEGYRFPEGTVRAAVSLLRGKQPADGARIWICAPGAAALRLAQDKNAPVEKVIRTYCVGSPARLPVPGHYLLADKAAPELVYVYTLGAESAELAEAPAAGHPRGTELLPVQAYTADADGRIEVLLRAAGTLTALFEGKIFTAELAQERQEIVWKLGG